MNKTGLGMAIFVALAMLDPKTATADEKWNLGAGLGTNYGGSLGVNAEVDAGDHLGFSVGLGKYAQAGVGWSAGGNLYFRSREHTWRPRVCLRYESGYLAEVQAFRFGDFHDVDDFVTKNALTVGVGSKWMFGHKKRHGLDLDLTYFVTPSDSRVTQDLVDEYVRKGYDDITVDTVGAFHISIGYRIAF